MNDAETRFFFGAGILMGLLFSVVFSWWAVAFGGAFLAIWGARDYVRSDA